MKYRWHLMMAEYHYRMCHVWNLSYHYKKWKYHFRRCFEIKGLDYDKDIFNI